MVPSCGQTDVHGTIWGTDRRPWYHLGDRQTSMVTSRCVCVRGYGWGEGSPWEVLGGLRGLCLGLGGCSLWEVLCGVGGCGWGAHRGWSWAKSGCSSPR